MKRNLFITRALIGLLVMVMVPFGAFGQDAGTAGTFSPQELDQMLAPIALYPDSLLAQVLIAATYPDQVAEADRWMKANPNLKGDALNDALDKMTWDLSVKALAPFPQVLDMMAKETAWTQRLGEAFLAQQADVMDAVQKLRQKAEAAGNLKSTEQMKVVTKGEAIEIEPANPEVVYVPRYDPVVVYGPWWYPAYPPLVYSPCCWPGVAVGLGVFGFWGAVAVGPVWGWGWGSWGWGGHNVNINVNRNININRNVNISRNSVRTTSLHQAAAAGKIGSGRAAAAARASAGRAGAGAGRAGVGAGAGRAGAAARGAGSRPSATSVQQGLKGGGARGGAGGAAARSGGAGAGAGRGTGATARGAGGSRAGGAGGAAARSGGTGAGRAGGAAARSGGAGGGRAGGAARSGGAPRGGGARGGGAPRGGGAHGGGAPRGGGGGGKKK